MQFGVEGGVDRSLLREARSVRATRAMVLGNYINALGIVRSLAQVGVHSLVGVSERSVAESSRWASPVQLPSPLAEPDNYVQGLLRVGRAFEEPLVLFATADEHVELVDAARDVLSERFIIPWASHEVLQTCLDKDQTLAAAARLGVPHPRTFHTSAPSQMREAVQALGYPVVVKPITTIGFLERLQWAGRSQVLRSQSDLDRITGDLRTAGLDDRHMVVQEYVEGSAERLWTFTSYSDTSGKVVAWSTGHKVRQHPSEGGTIDAGRVRVNTDLVIQGRRLLDGLGYVGIANTEFKLGPDGVFRLIEVNPRPGMWNASALATGVNLPAMVYSEAVGHEFRGRRSSEVEVTWVLGIVDLFHAVVGPALSRKPRLTLRDWRGSVPGPRAKPLWRWDDPGPGVAFVGALTRSAVARLMRRIAQTPDREAQVP